MYLPDVSLVIVGRFQNEGAAGEGGMRGNPSHGLHADLALAQFFMAILMRATGVLVVVEVDRSDLKHIRKKNFFLLTRHVFTIP